MADRKGFALPLAAVLIWLAIIVPFVWPLVIHFDFNDYFLSILSCFSAGVWWITLLWALHHLTYQVTGLFYRPKVDFDSSHTPDVAILYATCDDFNPNFCRSCIELDYPQFRVLICDDSRQDDYRELIDNFCNEYPSRCKLVRRRGRNGFKAGNLNNAIRSEVNEECVLLVDADQQLPADYLTKLMRFVPESDMSLAFVQAAHESLVGPQCSHLQTAMAPGPRSFCQRDLPLRNQFGFVPMLGHGTLIPTRVLLECGGFPEVVSEDFAFAIQQAQRGLRGRYVPFVVSQETFPHDFPAFVVRLRKYASGTAQLFRRMMPAFLFSRHNAYLSERWDFLFVLGWYCLMPLIVINGFVAAYVCHRHWVDEIPIVTPFLPYLFTWLALSSLAISATASDNFRQTIRFYFWSGGIYASALPLASWAFVKHLFVSPVFERTPKNNEFGQLDKATTLGTQGLGVLAIVLSVVWYSPFSFVLAGQGVSYLAISLFHQLCNESPLARLARFVVVVPSSLFWMAVVAVWYWAYL